MASYGLEVVMGTYLDSLKSVIGDFGPPKELYDDDLLKPRTEEELKTLFNRVETNQDRIDLLDSSTDLKFIDASSSGDLLQGVRMIEELVFSRTKALVDDLHYELRMLYSIYVIQIVIVVYFLVFRKTIEVARYQIVCARTFVALMPTYLLTRTELNTVRAFFDENFLDAVIDDANEVEEPQDKKSDKKSETFGRKSSTADSISGAVVAGPDSSMDADMVSQIRNITAKKPSTGTWSRLKKAGSFK
mmetsp:Transcript_23147/g.44939  ORF Transcript_23147/g.44939 Transcript_23147/m.44939 type:complete len:246 (-) Transcript_23147:3-740(-)